VFKKNKSEFYTNKTEQSTLPVQDVVLAGVYADVQESQPFYQVNEIMQQIITKYQLNLSQSSEQAPSWAHPKRFIVLKLKKQKVGTIAEVHPAVLQSFGIKGKVSVFELNIDKILPSIDVAANYQPVPKFPSIKADISMIVDDQVMFKDIEQTVLVADKDMVRSVELFDVYKNDKIGVGKKSLAFSVTYRAADRTLTKTEVDKVHAKIVAQLEKGLGAEIRK